MLMCLLLLICQGMPSGRTAPKQSGALRDVKPALFMDIACSGAPDVTIQVSEHCVRLQATFLTLLLAMMWAPCKQPDKPRPCCWGGW